MADPLTDDALAAIKARSYAYYGASRYSAAIADVNALLAEVERLRGIEKRAAALAMWADNLRAPWKQIRHPIDGMNSQLLDRDGDVTGYAEEPLPGGWCNWLVNLVNGAAALKKSTDG